MSEESLGPQKSSLRILFLSKENDPYARSAGSYLSLHAEYCEAYYGNRSLPWPVKDSVDSYDYVISYLSPWIVPSATLDRATTAAINFHPGPPEYPGIGCTNFAIYEGAREFGVTCHRMHSKVDTGHIIRVERFPLYDTDTVYSLTQRCYAHLAAMFYKVADMMLAGRALPDGEETWTRLPYRRAELDALCQITPDLAADEIARRIRATTYPGHPGAFVQLGQHRFDLTEGV